MTQETDRQIGPYRILETLGQGGMGVVYRGVHRRTGEVAAVKTVRVPRVGLLAGIRREIHALARIRHPGIIRIVDEGVQDGLPWYAMDLLEGQSLRQEAIRMWALTQTTAQPKTPAATTATELANTTTRTPLRSSVQATVGDSQGEGLTGTDEDSGDETLLPFRPLAAGGKLTHALGLMQRLCSPLAFLHGEGIVHRDLKPENVYIIAGSRPIIVDFGLMSQFGGEISREVLEVGGVPVGTAAYMAPEQVLGELVDARADLYSLGCILYELVTGRRPFPGATSAEISMAHLESEPLPPSVLVSGIPPALEALILQLLAKRPQERLGYASDVAEVLAEINQQATQEPARPEPVPRPYLYRPRLAGREGVLHQLEADLQALRAGQGGAVFIAGESGVGKTRLAMEVAKAARRSGTRVLIGEGTLVTTPRAPGETGAALPLHPLKRALQAIADRCRELGPEETERLLGGKARILGQYEPALTRLPGLPELPELAELPATAARLRLFRALAETLSALASGDRPLMLVLDDLQWADELTLGFLRYYLQAQARGSWEPVPWLILGAYRTEEVGEGLRSVLETEGSRHLELGRLQQTAVSRMIGDMLALHQPPPDLIQFVTQHSEGNPFFVAEYLRSAVSEGLLVRNEAGQWRGWDGGGQKASLRYETLPLPGSVLDLVARRLERRSAMARHLIEISAVLGREVDEVLLAKMARMGGASLMDAIDELIVRQILEEEDIGQLRFVHDKFREVAYERLAPRERKELHLAAAEAMDTLPESERDKVLAALGHHWEEAGFPARAQPCYLTEARRAASRSAHLEAERLYRAYLRLSRRVTSQSVKARIELGRDVLEVQGRNAQALIEHQQALAEARALNDADCVRLALLRVGSSFWMLARIEEARSTWTEALRLSREQKDLRDEGRALGNLALADHSQGRLEEARILYEQALALKRQVGDRSEESITLGNLAIVHDDQGRPELARKLHLEALALARLLQDRRLEGIRHSSLAFMDFERGRLDRAQVYFELALDLLREVGDRRQEGMVLGYLANLREKQGRLEDARALYDRTLAIQAEVGDRRSSAIFLLDVANLERKRENLDLSERFLEKAEAIHRELKDNLYQAMCLCARGHLALARGQPAQSFLQEASALLAEANLSETSAYGKVLLALREAVQSAEASPAERPGHP